jgi:hypothetical protein
LGREFSSPAAPCAPQSGLSKKLKAKTTNRIAPSSLQARREKCLVEFKCYQPILLIFCFKQI